MSIDRACTNAINILGERSPETYINSQYDPMGSEPQKEEMPGDTGHFRIHLSVVE